VPSSVVPFWPLLKLQPKRHNKVHSPGINEKHGTQNDSPLIHCKIPSAKKVNFFDIVIFVQQCTHITYMLLEM
jgi:hypothetical protein